MKKLIAILSIFIIIFSVNIRVFADDIDEEENLDEINEEVLNASTTASTVPKINSRAVLILDTESNKVIYEKNGYTKRAMASTTKIMKTIEILEKSNLADIEKKKKKAGGTGGSRLGLKSGDKVSVNDLLYGLMLRSRK